MKTRQKPAKRPPVSKTKSETFTAEERAAAKARVQEMKTQGADGESAIQAALAALKEPDRSLGKRLHAVIKSNAPALSAKTWYGMPAYATAQGKIVCHFQPAQKFKTRYATLGFSDQANLDQGGMWPVAFALKELGPAEEARIAALLEQALR